MVKADAYGLGMPRVVDALRHEASVWAFGVATVAEAEALRACGWHGRVLVFSPAPPGEFLRAARANLTLCLSDLDGVARWADAAAAQRQNLAFHTEVDTGMGRAGFAAANVAEWGPAVARLTADRLRWEGVYTHFHSADEPDLRATDEQWERFRGVLGALPPEPLGSPRRLVHVANSAASLRRGGYHLDLVRPGIFMYGGAVGANVRPEAVANVRARLVLARQVEPGATAGYGATYQARGHERWGTVAIGYGDGLPRVLAAGGEALIRGRRVPMIGRISMDVTTVDLASVPDAVAGDVVTVLGRDGDEEITVDQVAALCGTISYEVLTGLTPRLPRVYV